MRVVTCHEMKKIEELTYSQYGFSESLIIENVGLRGAEFIAHDIPDVGQYHEIIFVIGKGNNGADGLAIARNLHRYGYQIHAFLLADEKKSSIEQQKQLKIARAYGVPLTRISDLRVLEDYFQQREGTCLCVDSIFGTGIRLPIDKHMRALIEMINLYAHTIIALDIPSGIEGDSGQKDGVAIQADHTMAIGAPKKGHYIASGLRHSGKMKILDAGFPEELLLQGERFLLDNQDGHHILQAREKFASKHLFGRSLVIGGSEGLTGALNLASEASLRVGAGLVTGATWEGSYLEFCSSIIPEVMKKKVELSDIEEDSDFIHTLGEYDSIVIGPGLGRSSKARKLVINVVKTYQGPLVLDADAIYALDLEKDRELLFNREYPTLLTPHLGEFAGLIKEDISKIKLDPIAFVEKFIMEYNVGLLLKGPCTYFACSSQLIFLSCNPNDGMSTAGSGDVLSGILGGLLAQNSQQVCEQSERKDQFARTISLAVILHSMAGASAANSLGSRFMGAKDISSHLSVAFMELEKMGES